jgi:hypothetical protein
MLTWAQGDEDTLRRIDERFKEPLRFGTPPREHFPRYKYPTQYVPLESILQSPLQMKAVEAKSPVQDIRTDLIETLPQKAFVNVHTLPDEHGFFYIQEKDGTVRRRIHTTHAKPINLVTEMYEPPRQYSAITKPLNENPYDPKVSWLPELGLTMGLTQSNWTADLLDAPGARSALFTRFGLNALLDWKEQYQLGGTFQYEMSAHDTPFGTANYRSPSFGVVAKTKKIETGVPWRLGSQLRLAPLSNLQVPRAGGTSTAKIRSYVWQLSWESPHRNRYGDWAWGVSVQREWSKVTQQTERVSLDAKNQTNDQIGFFFSQGFTW